MLLLAIDPGPVESAFACLEGGRLVDWCKAPNLEVLAVVRSTRQDYEVVIEMIASYGMPVGREVFETCVWIGQFLQEAGRNRTHRLFRQDVKLHLCKSTKANDASIRQALIDRYGPGKEKAIGTKKAPGPLYGVKADVWAALALAVTWHDTRDQRLKVS
jgi:hypothetical protein